jgi:hypothetical protein
MPSQTTQSGKYLSTNGTDVFWANVSGAAGGTVTNVSTSTVNAPFISATVTDPASTPLITFAYTGTALPAANGGTGQTSYTIGDILYASGTTALSKLAGAATGNALISGGTNTAPSWGKVGLTTHVSGTLPVANGGTGATTLTGILKGNGTSAFTAATAGTDYLTPTGSGASLTNLNAGNISSGTLAIARGGTAVSTAPTSGQLLIGTSGGGYNLSTLTAGSGISITNNSGSVTITSLASGGTVTSVDVSGGTTGLAFSGGPISTTGTLTASWVAPLTVTNGGTGANSAASARTNLGLAIGTDVQAYDADLTTLGGLAKTDGNFIVGNGTTWVTESGSTVRTSLGATTVGSNFFTLANPGAVTFPRINADNSVSTLDAATFRTAIGAGTSSATGTVTSVGGTGTVSGLTLTGTVTSSGNLTLGGTLSVTGADFGSQIANTVFAAPNGVGGNPSFRALVASDIPTLNQNTTGTASNVTGTVAVANGGTGATTAANARTNLGLVIGTDVLAPNGSGASLTSLNAGNISSGTLAVARGGTGQTSYTDGQLLIGNSTGNTLSKATLTAGSGITITNGAGSITITATTGGTGTVTSVGVSGGTTGLTTSGGPITGAGTITLAGTLGVANGGTGATTLTGILKGNGTSAFTAAVAGTDYVLPNGNITGTAANVTGVVAAANGGTGQSSYTVGDILYASTTTALSKLTAVATGSALISGGAGAAASWGKIGLTTHITGTLPAANGGTGFASYTLGDILYASGTSAVSKLAGNTAATKQFLSQTGTGTVSAAPVWSAVSKSDVGLGSVENTALSTWAGSTNVTTLGTVDTGTWNATTISVAKGGTGQTTYTNGQLLIGNTTGNTLTKATLTAGSGITITNGAGSITIASTAGGGTVTNVSATVPAFLSASVTDPTTTPAIGITLSGTALPVANGGTGQTTYTDGQLLIGNTTGNTLAKATLTAGSGITVTNGAGSITVANSGVTSFSAGTTGLTPNSSTTGAVTLAGTLAVANGGTGQTTYTNGQLLIGNTTGNTLTKATLTQGTGITITNGTGSITVANAGVTSFSAGTTGLTPSTSTTGAVTLAGVLGVANGGTGAATLTGIVKGNGTSGFTAVTAPAGTIVGTTDTQTLTNKTLNTGTIDAGVSVSDIGTISASSPGFRGVPQLTKSANYTLGLSDAGKHISITTGGIAIPANGTTAFPVGTTIVVFNNSGSNQTISITTDTLRLAGTATTGSRTLAQYGVATLMKVASTTWVCMGAGVT